MSEQTKRNPDPSLVPYDDPRFPIWGRLWKARVPRIAAFSTAYLEHVGIPVSGFADVDLGQMTKLDVCYITIDKMVEYYHAHVEVRIVNQKDVKEIFEACQDYTFRAARMVQYNEVMDDIPVADLIKIDEFAAAVYEHAGHEYGHDKEFIKSFFSEGAMQQAMEIHAAFESIDKHMKTRKNKKSDHYTVYTELSGSLRDRNKAAEKEVVKYELPDRPTARHIFDAMLGNVSPGDRV